VNRGGFAAQRAQVKTPGFLRSGNPVSFSVGKASPHTTHHGGVMRTIARQHASQTAQASGRSSTVSQPAHGGAKNVRTSPFAAAAHTAMRTEACKPAATRRLMAFETVPIEV